MKKFAVVTIMFFCVSIGNAQKQATYTNPILAGFYPDPSICRVGNDYYLVNSTFSYFPGSPVFHSTDLVNWKLVGHVITREEQMDFTGKGVSRSLFAPTIRYYNGLFYVTCTMIDGGGNFVVTATNPAGPWSAPTWLPINGIDPSLFFDDDSKCYITYNSIPPDNKSLYNGHRTIRINEFDYRNGKILGPDKILVNGGTDISKKPSWVEGPHIVKKEGYYYLISAEGGTGPDHSVVAFRSKDVLGPYESYDNNPILKQHISAENKHPVTSAGHADFVELPDGRWYTVFLATRPYEEDHFNTGRETFLTPVEWKEGWPLVNPRQPIVNYPYPLPFPNSLKKGAGNYSGNFSYTDNFKSKTLSPDWIFLRTVKQKWYSLPAGKGVVSLKLRPETVTGRLNPSYIARRQQHTNFSASLEIDFKATKENEKAGLLCFIHEDHFYFLCISSKNDQRVVQLFQSPANKADSNSMHLLAEQVLPTNNTALQLKVDGKGGDYQFLFSLDKKHWTVLRGGVDGKFLSTKTAGGFGGNFVGNTIGLYATSLGQASTNSAEFNWFQYTGNDDVFR